MEHNSTKIIFLDRDGVINKEVGYLYQTQNFKFIDGIFDLTKEKPRKLTK